NRYLPSLSSWRPLVVILFLRWFAHLSYVQRDYWYKLWRERKILRTSALQLWEMISDRLVSRLLPWDKYAALLFAVILISVGFAKFPGQALRQILFLLNAYLLYVVVINVVTSKQQVVRLIRYAALSTGVIVSL